MTAHLMLSNGAIGIGSQVFFFGGGHDHFLFTCTTVRGVFGSDHVPDSAGRFLGLLSTNGTPFCLLCYC
jgi:hypothetical protein